MVTQIKVELLGWKFYLCSPLVVLHHGRESRIQVNCWFSSELNKGIKCKPAIMPQHCQAVTFCFSDYSWVAVGSPGLIHFLKKCLSYSYQDSSIIVWHLPNLCLGGTTIFENRIWEFTKSLWDYTACKLHWNIKLEKLHLGNARIPWISDPLCLMLSSQLWMNCTEFLRKYPLRLRYYTSAQRPNLQLIMKNAEAVVPVCFFDVQASVAFWQPNGQPASPTYVA